MLRRIRKKMARRILTSLAGARTMIMQVLQLNSVVLDLITDLASDDI